MYFDNDKTLADCVDAYENDIPYWPDGEFEQEEPVVPVEQATLEESVTQGDNVAYLLSPPYISDSGSLSARLIG